MKAIIKKIGVMALAIVLAMGFAASQASAAYTYTASPNPTTNGGSTYPGSPKYLKMSVSISGSSATFTVTKTDGGSFTHDGDVYLKVCNSCSGRRFWKDPLDKPVKTSVTQGAREFKINYDLSKWPFADSSTADFYVLDQPRQDPGQQIWVGPITITRKEVNPTTTTTTTTLKPTTTTTTTTMTLKPTTTTTTMPTTTTTTIPNKPPTVSITNCPTSPLQTSSYTFNWIGKDADGYISGYFYGLDNPNPNIPTSRTSYTWTGLSNGSHTFYVKAQDNLRADSNIASCTFNVDSPDIPTSTWNIKSDIPYAGGYASGKAYILLSNLNQKLTNPVIVVEGFDGDNNMDWKVLYQQLNQQSLVTQLRAKGYDLVVLDFTDAIDYIQRNAFLLVKLIQLVNKEKISDNELVIMGPSMGGLVARYALSYMETKGMEHETETFISFDTPHRGANIPVGLQHWLAFFADQGSPGKAAKNALRKINSPAAKQMLVYHYAIGSDNLRATFQTELKQMGEYPLNVRKVAVANGSGYGSGMAFKPGEQIIGYKCKKKIFCFFGICSYTLIKGNAWAVPNVSPSTRIFEGFTDGYSFKVGGHPADTKVSISSTLPYDNAPGGMSDTTKQIADSSTGDFGDITTNYPYHSFIPTVSALDIDTTDLFYNVANDPKILDKTPFDAVYYPRDNQAHMAITPESVIWFINEITGTGSYYTWLSPVNHP